MGEDQVKKLFVENHMVARRLVIAEINMLARCGNIR